MKIRTAKRQTVLKALSFILAMTITLNISSVSSLLNVSAEGLEDPYTVILGDEISSELPDSAELERMYIEQLFYGEGPSVYKDHGRDTLEGDNLQLYDFLKENIEKVAAGEKKETTFEYTFPTPYTDENVLQGDIVNVIVLLMADLPQAFYWFDKTGFNYLKTVSTSGETGEKSIIACTFMLSVSEDYADKSVAPVSGYYLTVDTAKINSAKTAVANAQKIAAEYDGMTDYEKILGYKNRICNLTEYNVDAADDKIDTPYGDPWQLVYVFDDDPDTKVVCEGYSKAFQYLCDLGGIDCYTVTGEMAGGTGAGKHMWNIVVLNGKSYLVDITNCDGNSAGNPDKLLLKGAATSDANGCVFTNTNPHLTYTYDANSSVYPDAILTVSTEDYDPNLQIPDPDTPHSHRVCTGAECCPNGVHVTHTEIQWDKWESTYSMPLTAGNYYLTADVTLSESWALPSGATSLCLNGHSITVDSTAVSNSKPLANGIIYISSPSDTLNLCDCGSSGKITGGRSKQGGGVYNNGTFNMFGGEISGNSTDTASGSTNHGGGVYSVGTFNMYGGKISGNTAKNKGDGVYVHDSSTFRMYGGEISGNVAKSSSASYGFGVYINNKNAVVVIGGTAVIRDNKYTPASGAVTDKNLYLPSGAVLAIDISCPLRGKAYIGITTAASPGSSSPVNITGTNGDDYSRYFDSDISNRRIINSADNIVQLATGSTHIDHKLCVGNDCLDEIHGSHETITWTRWTGTSALPTAPGHYYLNSDVKLSASWEVPEGETSICLNGKTISAAGVTEEKPLEHGLIYISGSGRTFNLCDCTSDGKVTGGISSNGGAVYIGYNGIFNMYSGEISGNTATSDGGAVYNLNGTFNMYNGEISGNTSKRRAGGVNTSGTFNMYNGTIRCNETGNIGGGVHISSGTFNMHNGVIEENCALGIGGAIYGSGGAICIYGGKIINNLGDDHGGSICNFNSSFKMLGGEISGNYTNGVGGGVHTHNSNVTIGGTAVIRDNFGYARWDSDGNITYKGVPDDLYLMANSTITIDPVTPFEKGAYIGLRTHDQPDEGKTVPFTRECDRDYSEFFDSNVSNIDIRYRDGAMCLKMPSHEHMICQGIDCPDRYHVNHTVVEWTRWDSSTSAPTESGYYFLGTDVKLTESWEPADGTTLCLNGHTITAALTVDAENSTEGNTVYIPTDYSLIHITDACNTFNLCDCTGGGRIADNITTANGGGVFIENPSCTFTMYRGEISGNTSPNGGGIYNNGTFKMYTGKISGNTSTTAGGGVYNNGIFDITDGEISKNTGNRGGGMANSGTVNMNGGDIINNTALTLGGGVYTQNNGFTVGGDAVIKDNTANGSPDNVGIGSNTLLKINPDNLLNANAYIGITTETKPDFDSDVDFTAENADDYSEFFHSDDPTYAVAVSGNNVLQLYLPHDHTIVKVEALAPKCEEKGYEEYYECSVCGKLFDDENGLTRIYAVPELAPTGHKWGSWQKDAEKHWQECENRCGKINSENSHIWDKGVVTLEPTAENEGLKTFTCQVCKHTGTEAIPKLGAPETTPPETTPPATAPAETEPVTAAPVPEPIVTTSIRITPVETVPDGKIFKSEKSDDYTAEIQDKITDLASNLLTNEEIVMPNSGSIIELRLTIDKLNKVTETESKAIESVLNGYVLSQNLDINLFKIIDGTSTKLTETKSPITITIKLPEELIKAGREFSIIRVHNGAGTMIRDIDNEEDTVTFATDKFSVYALAYKDKEAEDGPMNTGAADYTATFLAVGITALAVSAALTAMGSGIGGMSEDSKDRLYYKLLRWGKKGGKIRRLTALALIFLLLSYYYGIGAHQYEFTEWTAD